MAGEQYNVTKVIRNGDEYYFPGAGKIISKKIFGTGCDGDCVVEYCDETRGNVFMEAKEYNFCNFTVCPNVKLRFCGNGVPIIRVKERLLNCGTIDLRNPLITTCPSYSDPYLKKIIQSRCNTWASSAQSLLNYLTTNLTLEKLSSYCAAGGACSCGYGGNGGAGGMGGKAGMNGCPGGDAGTWEGGAGGTGGTTSYDNAGGGGGGGGGYYRSETGHCVGNGGNAPRSGFGGNGGQGGTTSATFYGRCEQGGGAGGGGGYGYCCGGSGGDAGRIMSCYNYPVVQGNGGNGGNSYLGGGGQGGNVTGGYNSCCTTYKGRGGNGGSSYYGNGGNGGSAQFGTTGKGGCSFYGNGGSGSGGGCTVYGNTYSTGGDSVYGCAYNNGTGISSALNYAYCGMYGIGLFGCSICNVGRINGDGGCSISINCGAEIYMVYHEFSNSGIIECKGGCCCNNCSCKRPVGFVCSYQI